MKPRPAKGNPNRCPKCKSRWTDSPGEPCPACRFRPQTGRLPPGYCLDNPRNLPSITDPLDLEDDYGEESGPDKPSAASRENGARDTPA